MSTPDWAPPATEDRASAPPSPAPPSKRRRLWKWPAIVIGALFAIGMIVNAVKPSDDKPSVDPWITGHMSQITQLNAAIQAFDGAVGRKDIVGGAQSAQQVADGFE